MIDNYILIKYKISSNITDLINEGITGKEYF